MADQALNVPDDLEDDATPAPAQADDTAIPESAMETEPDIQPTSEPTVAAPAQPARTTYSIGGVAISLPSDLSDADRAKAVSTFVQSDDFKQYLDQDTGAPAFVRAQVGGAAAQDRLANIKRFYPDAAAYGDDNFVYTNPETGKMTLFNPPGMDLGDVAGFTREIFVGAGATMGATAGALSGLATGPGAVVASPTMAAVGAGTGGAVGGELFDAYSNVFLGRVDSRSVLDRSVGAGTEFLVSASGQRAGELLEAGVKRAFGAGTKKAAQIAEKFRSLRIEPPAAAVSSSNTVTTLSNVLSGSPFSGDIVQKRAKEVVEQISRAARDIVEKIAKPVSKAETGSVIRTAASNAAGRFKTEQNLKYEKAFDLIGADTPIAIDAVRALRERLELQLRDAPGSLKKSLGKAINTLKVIEIEDTANSIVPGTVKFKALRQIRTDIGKDLDEPMTAGNTGSQNAAMRLVYGALTEDMSSAAKLAGNKAAMALADADLYTKAWMDSAGVLLNKIGKFDTDEQAYNYAVSRLGDGGTNLQRLREQFEPEEWDTIAASVLDRMGLAKASAQDASGEVFSANTFLTNWSKMSDEAKNALFGGARYTEIRAGLDTLVEVVSSLRGVEKLANTSNTGRVMITYLTLTGAASGLAELGAGQGAGAISAFLVGGIGSRYAAKLLTSPKFVNWLTTPVSNPKSIYAHFGRLGAIAAKDPALKEPVQEFLKTFRPAPQPQGVDEK